ncbi:MAG: hypothetical protein JST58_07045 [Bacteroidetes bacterium]|nr:hypothetical protein [Bacteroidota bacterium]
MNEEKLPNKNEEIDLLYFLNPVFKAIRNILLGVANYFRLLWSGKWLFILLMIVISLAAFSLRYILPKAYKTSAIFISHSLDAKLCSVLINNLDYENKNDNQNLISSKLNISKEAAGNVKWISAKPIEDSLTAHTIDSAASIIHITLRISSDKDISAIQAGLAAYLENNEYSLKRKKARIKTLEALNADYENKINSLDSLKKIVNNSILPRSSGQGIILGQPIEPVGVYRAQSEYYKNLLSNNEELSTIKNIEILQPFFLPDSYNYPNFNRLLFIIVSCGFVFGLFIIPIWVFQKRKQV